MTRDDWKQALVLTLVLGLVALAIWVIRFDVQLTPSQARALASMHVFVHVAVLCGAAFAIGSFISSRRGREASTLADTADGPEGNEPAPSAPEDREVPPAERWLTLIETDVQVRSAAEQLSTYGIKWVAALGREFMAAGEDRTRLSAIVKRLRSEAEREDEEREARAREAQEREAREQEEQRWAAAFGVTAEGERVTPEALKVLRLAKLAGYDLSVDTDGTIIARTGGTSSYLNSISDIMLFSKNRLAA